MRARILKPGFFKNDEIAQLPPLTRIMYQGLWCMADGEGRLEDRPIRIKAECLPYDDHDVSKALDTLTPRFLVRYKGPTGPNGEPGQALIQIVDFAKHQRITGKEATTPSLYAGVVEDAPPSAETPKAMTARDTLKGILMGMGKPATERTLDEWQSFLLTSCGVKSHGEIRPAVTFLLQQANNKDGVRAEYVRQMAHHAGACLSYLSKRRESHTK
jgi:hypothetical protein